MNKLKTITIIALAAILVCGAGTIYTQNLKIESNGGLAVNIQDQTSPPLDLYFSQAQGAPSTLAAVTAIDDMSISVTGNIISTGDYVGVFSGASGEGRFYFGEAMNVTGTGPYTVALDTPLDFAFDSGDPVISTTRELDVNGSVTPQLFSIQIGGAQGNVKVDITRIIVSMKLSSAGAENLFGNIAALTSGVVLRRKNGDTRNVWTVKDNSDFGNLSFDTDYTDKVGSSDFGFKCRYTFAGQDKHGVAVRLEPGDFLELIIQDDLTALNGLRIIAAGHVVAD
jgi:uncharacterized protein YdeI (BOF family)